MSYTPLSADPEKLRKVFARLDANDESGRQVAFNIATKALADSGISWSDLLEAHLKQTPSPSGHSQADGLGSIFDGVFGDFVNAYAKAKPQPHQYGATSRSAQFRDPDWRQKIYVTGREAPDKIAGTIRELERRRTKKGGPMLVVQVETPTHIYGPFAMFSQQDVDLFESGREKTWSGWIKQPTADQHLPTFSQLRS